MLGKVLPLSRVIAIPLTAIVVGGALLSSYAIEAYVSKRTQEVIGRAVATLAIQLQDNFDRGLFERYRELSLAAAQSSPSIDSKLKAIERWIATRNHFDTDFNWLGLVLSNGDVLAEAGRKQNTKDFLRWPSVETLLSHPERPEAQASLRYNSSPGGAGVAAAPVIEIAAPVFDESGQTKAFLLASLNWEWAREASGPSNVNGPAGSDVFVVSDRDEILLGLPSVQGPISGLRSVRNARNGQSSYELETWPDGVQYITGFARSDGHRNFGGFGWIILVRQNAEIALTPIQDLKHHIWTIAALFALHSIILSWILGWDIAAPLLRLSKAADAVRRQEGDQQIPVVSNYVEAKSLSLSLISLVEELKAREAAQVDLSSALERQVADRTAELEQRNISLDEAKRTAETATLAKSRFLAAASHDLRQPLHALMLFVRVLKRRTSGTDVMPLVANIDDSVSSLTKMFDAFLHVSRLDSGGISARLNRVPLHELMESLAAGFQAEARQRGLSFRFRNSLHFVVLTDPALLETIVRNLLSNALKFTKTGGILLASRKRGEQVVIEIYDTGPGIALERIVKIFDEFERDRMQADGPNEGLGLGLSIVQRYATIIGANVSVASAPGRGSRFSVFLQPLGLDPGIPAIPVEQRGTGYLDNLRIMLVDDNTQVLEALSRDLADHGALVTAFDGVEAADKALLAGFSADIAIVDYDLGGPETGLKFLQRTKSQFREQRASFILTGRTDSKTLDTISESGMTFLVKPADSASIANHLTNLCADERKPAADPHPGNHGH